MDAPNAFSICELHLFPFKQIIIIINKYYTLWYFKSILWLIIDRNSSDVSYNEIGGREGRAKRGVPELYSMIKCATGCDPLIYKGYGCYCGFLGDGNTLDGIDR